jgi:hypothetical protein
MMLITLTNHTLTASKMKKTYAISKIEGIMEFHENISERAMEVVCAINNINREELKTVTRRPDIAHARSHFWNYLIKRIPTTYKALGEFFDKDHATVLYHVRNHSEFMEPIRTNAKFRYNEQYAVKYDTIESILDEEFKFKKLQVPNFKYRITALVDDPQRWTRIIVEHHEEL